MLIFSLAGSTAQAQQAEDAARLGESIFRRGEALTLEEVQIGDPPSSAPISLFPCQGCHQENGQGIQEGGVVAPNIRWPYLTKPYSVRGGPFRLRPAYDERLFARALREGVDSAGRSLGLAMPRYALSEVEIAGLIAYLQRLGQAEGASAFGAEIPIGVRLPTARPQAEVMQAVLEVFFENINRRGGIFERKVTLRFATPAEPFGADLAAGLDLSIPAAPDAPGRALPVDAAPTLFLFTSGAGVGKASGRKSGQCFGLYSGPEDRAAALLRFAGRTLGIAEAEILRLGDEVTPESVPRKAPRALLFGGNDAATLRRTLAGLPPTVPLLLSRWLENPALMDLAKEQARPVFVATPPAPELAGRAGQALYAQLNALRPLPAAQRMVQLWALAAAETLAAALEEVGRDLHPQALVEILEGFSRHSTGFGPSLHFSVARHLGARGAFVFPLGEAKEAGIAGQWIELD